MSVSMLASRLGCEVVGVDFIKERCKMAEQLGVVKRAVCTREMDEEASLKQVQSEDHVFQVAVDCSGAEKARLLALKGLFGRV